MKHVLLNKVVLGILTLVAPAVASAQEPVISNVQMERSDNKLIVSMDMDMSQLDVNSNRIETLTPVLVAGSNSLNLKSVGVYGRSRYYYTQRNPKKNPLTAQDIQLRTNAKDKLVHYTDVVELQDWMNQAELRIGGRTYGCVSCELANFMGQEAYKVPSIVIPEPVVEEVYAPEFVYVRPQAEAVKIRQEDATAYVNFRVNKTDIDPVYMSNKVELAKINETISKVAQGHKVLGIQMTGFASPEGSFASNERLAKGRVEAIRQYISVNQAMPKEQIAANYVPENWEGLRAYVEESNITHKQGILDIIDSNREADNKEAYLKSQYPAEYKQLLADCYPSLRRTNYSINYEVQHYTELEEIRQVYKTSPKDLSLEELYVLAQSYEAGSKEFNDVFQTAVRLFPNSSEAHFNAASNCMAEGLLDKAEEHLNKVKGLEAEVAKSRAILAELRARAK